ncbi:MAG: hypothetical protein WBO16_02075, partial [Gammaproteobacteria bacterium]
MKIISRYTKPVAISFFAGAIASTSLTNHAIAEESQELTVAFPDTWMIRLGAYVIDRADTTVSVNTDIGIGTVIDYKRDLGGEDSDTIPRIDAYYRFNKRHRIDFTAFRIDRKGERTLTIDLDIGDDNFVANETVFSDVKYTLYKLGYNYSFYHSPKVELSLSAGLNITDYELSFRNLAGDKAEAAGVTVPLPVFGLRMGYAITP